MTLWSPDTCECQIEYDPHPTEQDKVVHKETVKACPKHAHLAHTQAHADEVLRHNQAKNIAVNWLAGRLGKEISGAHGGYDRAAPNGADPVLISRNGHGLSGADLQSVQAEVDAQFGAGKVVLGGS